MKCQICNYENESKVSFARHLQMKHELTCEQYSITYLYDNQKPLCFCGKETRYHSFGFKKYCKEHFYLAESESGKIGGKIKKTWNKGQTKDNNDKLMEYSIKYTGEGNPFYGKKHPKNVIDSFKELRYLSQEEIKNRLEKREEDFEFYFNYDEYISRQYQYIKLKCKKCGYEDEKTLVALERGSKCIKCFPLYISSHFEQEIEEYIKSLGIVNVLRNSREVIFPKELDIFIPEKNVGVEYNGLFWHLEEKIGRNLHLDKTKRCLEKGIKLFHIFGDEWILKKDIVKSMLSYRLGIFKEKIYARDCEVKEIDNVIAKDFFDRTHICGSGKSYKKSFGIFYKDELIGCLSVKNPYKKKRNRVDEIIENARFSIKLNTCIVGGFSKLLKHAIKWAKENGYKKMRSFADRRFGEGDVYRKCGFELVGNTKENYWYTDCEKRYFRTQFRARFDKTERQIAKENKVYRIYGCGSNIYEYSF